ncbi:MAG: hypothetical protein U0R44_04430 [Candidatus Micrarchaeia archaeon]
MSTFRRKGAQGKEHEAKPLSLKIMAESRLGDKAGSAQERAGLAQRVAETLYAELSKKYTVSHMAFLKGDDTRVWSINSDSFRVDVTYQNKAGQPIKISLHNADEKSPVAKVIREVMEKAV